MLNRLSELQLIRYAIGSGTGGLSALRRLGSAPGRRLLSVDLFDTLLLRGIRPETARFRNLAERLEATSAAGNGCTTCGACPGVGMAVAGVQASQELPAWVDGAGRCRDCRRAVRVYAGVDLALV